MNKFLIITITFLGLCNTLNAQFDEKFYFPSKDYSINDAVDHEDLFFEIEAVKIHTLWLKPKQKTHTSILLFIGASGNASKYVSMASSLLSLGYQVLIFEPRGYGLSSGVPKHMNVISDAQLVFDNLLKKEEIKNTRIVIYGASLGSQVATHLTKNNQTKISGLIIDGGMSSFTDIALSQAPETQKPMIKQYLTSPYSVKEDIKQIEDVPKLLIHSREDKTVPFAQVELNYKNAQEPKELWVHKGGHLQALKEDKQAYIKIIGEFTNNLKLTK
ncbi:alpha/beta hydrolase [Dokdonia sp. Hel_I_53]|uniref:alpha/beta hydrolase n=1 Tax=Dokdonia sp. Hel_I_53 TaxID=1566287 RepID=UPI00119C812A|nr:alpha/beta fold hydrolase [Dokdonia sp. Hel_I_53]TVZ53060.1 hypothetical protein OD90_2252 [Dokdonia sp. Hel_I_53]